MHKTICEYRMESIVEDFPSLAGETSLRVISKVIFGVSSLTHLVDKYSTEDTRRLREFFGEDHSSLIDWSKHTSSQWIIDFYPLPEHRKIYKTIAKDLGLAVAVPLTEARDFPDIATGYTFLKADKRRLAKFHNDIVSAFHLFPKAAHANMIHDYIDRLMKAEERKLKPKLELGATFPQPENHIDRIDGFKILIPHNESCLRKIGRAQNHCVGTSGMGYAGKIKAGRVMIFALYENTLADGICVEFDLSDQRIIQAQGRHRRSPDGKEYAAIMNALVIMYQREAMRA